MYARRSRSRQSGEMLTLLNGLSKSMRGKVVELDNVADISQTDRLFLGLDLRT